MVIRNHIASQIECARTGRLFYVKYTGKIIEYLNRDYVNFFGSKDKNIINSVLIKHMQSTSLCDTPENIILKYPSEKESQDKTAYDALKDIENNRFYLVECKKSGRRFHNFLGLSRESRRAILIDGEKCAEVDYSACHPWLCYSFYQTDSDEKRRYLSALEFGFYKFIALELGINVSDTQIYQDFKISCIAQIFYDCPREQDGLKLNLFKNKFPELYHVIQSEKHKSNSDFAYKLQKMEADVMFDGAFFGLYQRDIKAIPIHDGVLCKESDKLAVQSIMENEFYEKYKYRPKVGIKELTY